MIHIKTNSRGQIRLQGFHLKPRLPPRRKPLAQGGCKQEKSQITGTVQYNQDKKSIHWDSLSGVVVIRVFHKVQEERVQCQISATKSGTYIQRVEYRDASLIRKSPPPWNHRRALGIGLL